MGRRASSPQPPTEVKRGRPSARVTPEKSLGDIIRPETIFVGLLAALVCIPSLDSIRTHLTTDAKPSTGSQYPTALLWGNAIWGVVAFSKHRSAQSAGSRPGYIFGAVISFLCYTMPANIATCLFFLDRTPSAFRSTTILPVHVFCYMLSDVVPAIGDVLSGALPFLVLDSLGVLDNATTQFNFMTEAFFRPGVDKSLVLAVLTGMCTNLAGGVVRHFAKHGFAIGAAKFDEALGKAFLYSLCTSCVYAYFALHTCDAKEDCTVVEAFGLNFQVIHLYESLAWAAVFRNAFL
jgi:hypothetical protein